MKYHLKKIYNTMTKPDYDQAIEYALNRLRTELSPTLYYHNIYHTLEGVLPAAVRIANKINIQDDEKNLIKVAAALHDIGFIYAREGHEIIGARISAQTLPGFGFTAEQVDLIMGMILATRLPQTPCNPLEEILADADLDVLGREDFFERSELLRLEVGANGRITPTQDWYKEQLEFLNNHTFFTAAAASLRNEGKNKNANELIRRIGEYAD